MTEYLYTRDLPQGDDESARYLTREFKRVEDHTRESVTDIDSRLDVLEDLQRISILIDREFGLLDGNLGSFTSGQIIDNWTTGSVVDAESQMVVSAANGSFTLPVVGVYQIQAILILSGTSNNINYTLFRHINGGAGLRIGYVFQASQADDAQIVSLGYTKPGAPGDVITLSITGAAYTLELAQISMALKIPS